MRVEGFLRSGVLLGLLPAALGGCVPLAPGTFPEERGEISRSGFGDLDPGAKSQTSLHFEVKAYGSDRAKAVSDLAEECYSRIMRDTGLYSFLPGGAYPIVLYADHAEFQRKTGLPPWSAGAAVGNSITSFDGAHLPGVLSHEMTHLIFNEHMGSRHADLRWINEGLAVFEEVESLPASARRGFAEGGRMPLPFSQMVSLAPLSEEGRSVNAWYAQVGSVVRFMIERGGRVGFSQFLSALRDGRPIDEAVRAGFPGLWGDFSALEKAWAVSAP